MDPHTDRLTTFYAILRPDSTVLVVGGSPRMAHQPIEHLTAQQFLERTEANRIDWRPGRKNVLTTTVDQPGALIMETRFQLR